MTGFLGRMAARASGREAGISPRVPGRFEGVEQSEPIVVEQAADLLGTPPGPTRPVVAAAHRPATRVGREPAHPVAPLPAAVGRGEQALPAEPARVEVSAEPRRLEAPTVEEVRSPRAVPAEPRQTTPQPSPSAAPVAQDLVVVTAAPAVALSSAAALTPAAGPAPVDPSPREPDVVRVSIGRVDVRASVAPPRQPVPREQTRPARPSSERLSLQDYLRGQREVR